MKKIYMVEDEIALTQLLVPYLEEAGYEVSVFHTGAAAKEKMDDVPDLWILDIMLPDSSGYELIKLIKEKNPDVSVIFMSARNAELDRVIGLEMGSDDYLPKPFMPRELVLRVNRLLKDKTKEVVQSSMIIGDLVFDMVKREIVNDTVKTALSVKEYDLLLYLIKNNHKAVSRDEILDNVWGLDYFGSDRVIDDTLRRLRKKIPKLPVETVYGYGYMLKVVAND